MNLPFRTLWPATAPKPLAGQPTYFVEQINNALVAAGICTIEEIDKYESAFTSKFGHRLRSLPEQKKHSIREDGKNRWKVGQKIHFFINNRTPQMFRFAPVVEVKAIQRIKFKYFEDGTVCVSVEDLHHEPNTVYQLCFYDKTPEGYVKRWNGTNLIEQIAINDGFNNVDDFLSWFCTDFEGKIIHWTNLTY